MSDPNEHDHWLVRPADAWFGFGAVFGFAACVAMVLVAKALGLVLKRDDDYYLRHLEKADDDD